MKRLTVHLANEPKVTKAFKDAEGKDVSKKILVNTLTFVRKTETELNTILVQLTKEGKTVTKHYVSNVY